MKLEKEVVLNWLLIGNLRYALGRDNQFAFYNYKMILDEAITWYTEEKNKTYITNKIIEEIEQNLKWFDRRDEDMWRELIKELKGGAK